MLEVEKSAADPFNEFRETLPMEKRGVVSPAPAKPPNLSLKRP